MITALIVLLSLVWAMWIWRHFRVSQAMREDLTLAADPDAPLSEKRPLVSILVPARNESANIERCLRAALSQNYRELEVVVVDDRSEDDTARIVRDIASEDARVRLLSCRELPEGWSGKNNALWQAAQNARGEVLFFIDADVTLDPGALSVMVKHMLDHDVDMLTLVLRLDMRSFWERAVEPITGSMLVLRFPLCSVNNPKSRCAFGNGQAIMMRAEVYREIGGHERVKSDLLEDIALARIVKGEGRRLNLAYGFDMAQTRMYDSLKSIWKGWTRIYYAGFRGSFPALLLSALLVLIFVETPYFTLIGSVAWIAVAGASPKSVALLALSAATVLTLWSVMARVYRWVRAYPLYVFAHFPASLVALGITFAAMAKVFNPRIEWKGTHYRMETGNRKPETR